MMVWVMQFMTGIRSGVYNWYQERGLVNGKFEQVRFKDGEKQGESALSVFLSDGVEGLHEGSMCFD